MLELWLVLVRLRVVVLRRSGSPRLCGRDARALADQGRCFPLSFRLLAQGRHLGQLQGWAQGMHEHTGAGKMLKMGRPGLGPLRRAAT